MYNTSTTSNTLNKKFAINNLTGDLLNSFLTNNLFDSTNIKKLDDSTYVSEFNVAGYDSQEIKIELSNATSYSITREIFVSADNQEYGKLSKGISVPFNIDEKTISAKLKNGLLKVFYSPLKTKENKTTIKIQVI
jgi:HSP20 family molecular chaperone IbpA